MIRVTCHSLPPFEQGGANLCKPGVVAKVRLKMPRHPGLGFLDVVVLKHQGLVLLYAYGVVDDLCDVRSLMDELIKDP